MSQKIIFLPKFIYRLGFWNGIKTFFQLSVGRLNAIKPSGIRFPFSLRNNSSDVAVFYHVFLSKQYQPANAEAPKVIIDGGSNIGLFSVKMKNLFPDATVIAIEPDPENFKMVQKNLAPYKNVFIENAGIWNQSTRLKVYDKFNSGNWGLVVEEDQVNGTINAISIDALMQKYQLSHIDILKLDIETSEKQVFAENYESWLPKVDTIIIELHDGMEDNCAKTFFEAINKTFSHYKFSMSGENTVIKNKDFEPGR